MASDETSPWEFERAAPDGSWAGSISGMCPVQGDGVVDGHPWYFRARGQRWSFDVADDIADDPVDVGHECGGWYHEEPWGETEGEAGYMPSDVAWGFLEHAIDLFRAGSMQRFEKDSLCQKKQPVR